LPLFALFIYTGLRGVDFGYHWDEAEWHLEPGRLMVKSGIFLPRKYIYPSFDKWLVIWPAFPAAIRAALENEGQPLAIQAAMVADMADGRYLLRARAMFIVVSSLGILWVYGAALALRYRAWQALVAAAGLGLSWEFAYHSRFAVADCLLVQFSALTLFMLALFRRTAQPHWLYAAACAVGLCTGTKYTGVFLLAPVLVTGFLSLPWSAYFRQAWRAALLCALAFGVYLILTPATVLDPFLWLTETHGISEYYKHSHGGYTAQGALHHAWIVLSYYLFAFYSPYQWLAVPLFVATVFGTVSWLRRDFRFGALLIGFPMLFLTMFCAQYRVVVVRNYLFVAPFFALLMARGVADLADWLPRSWQRWGLAAALLGALFVNGSWLIAAGESIRHNDPTLFARQALDYVRDHANVRFRVSRKILSLARFAAIPLPPNIVNGGDASEVVFFGDSEGPGSWNWRVNDPWLTRAVFGTREVNFNWYSSWSGPDRVVVMAIDKARATGVPLAK